MEKNNQYAVHIDPKRYHHVLDVAREGAAKVRDTAAKAVFWPDRDGRRRYELRSLGGDALQIMTASDPDELAKHVLKLFTQSLMDSLHYAMLYGHERTKENKIDMHIPGASLPENSMDVHTTTPPGTPRVEISLDAAKEREAAGVLAKGIRQAQMERTPDPAPGLSATRKSSPSPIRKPMPTMGGPSR
jgi:hypothetical protein